MIFSFLGILLIIYSRISFKKSFLLYMLLEIVWFPQAKLVDLAGLPSIPISLVMSSFFAISYYFKQNKIKVNSLLFPLLVPLSLLVVSRFASCFSSLAGFGDEFSRSIGYLFTNFIEIWLMWKIIWEEKDFDFILKGMVLIFLFAGVYGIIVFSTQSNPIFDYKSSLIEDGIDAYNAGDIRGYRLTSIFEHPLGAGMNFALYVLCILVAKFKYKFNKVSSSVIYVSVFLALICIFYTKMRAGLFMLILGIPAFVNLKMKNLFPLLGGLLILLILSSTVLSDQLGILESLFNKKAQDDVGGSNLEMRIEQFTACLFFLQQSPISGLGEQCLLYLNGIQAFQLRALESVVFEEMVRHGLLGLFATMVLMFYTTIKIPLKYKSQPLLFVSLAFWVTYISTSIPFFRIHLFYFTYFYIIFKTKRKIV